MDKAELIKSAIANRLCPVHDLHPIIEMTGSDVEIICCCELFYTQCLQTVQNVKYRKELERELNIK